MIEVSGLFKSYGPIQAIHDINFKVKKGEVVGFLGPNGAGKSTTMKIITGSMAPSGGSVRVAGFDVFEDPIEVKKRIGYLPENPPVYGDMSVESYLKFVAKLKGVEASRVKAQVEKSIEKTDLGSVRRRLIQNLSKGYRQRVGIAQALVSDPEVLILDEPTSGLDPRQVAEVRALIKELKGEHTIILSTHILPEVQAMCERIIIINRGHIVAQDSLEGLSTRMAGATQVKIKVARPSGEVEKSLQAIPGVSALVKSEHGYAMAIASGGAADGATDGVVERIAEAAVQSRAGLLELRRESADLEEIFLKLTTSEETQTTGGAV
ncbi:MAG: ABC transporter ATP-binding protein [Bdellovibrionaceae bacterium]|nr:ABC transporter ATP-binding protein [Pseudobdellovibrionaceae bacterium]